MKNWKTSTWFKVMAVGAGAAAVGGIYWYDWNYGWAKVLTVVGLAVALYSLYKVSGGNPGNPNHEMNK